MVKTLRVEWQSPFRTGAPPNRWRYARRPREFSHGADRLSVRPAPRRGQAKGKRNPCRSAIQSQASSALIGRLSASVGKGCYGKNVVACGHSVFGRAGRSVALGVGYRLHGKLSPDWVIMRVPAKRTAIGLALGVVIATPIVLLVNLLVQVGIMFGAISPPPALALLLGIDMRNSWTGQIYPLAHASAPSTYTGNIVSVRGFSSLSECQTKTIRHAEAIGLKDAGIDCSYRCKWDTELNMDVCWNSVGVPRGQLQRK